MFFNAVISPSLSVMAILIVVKCDIIDLLN